MNSEKLYAFLASVCVWLGTADSGGMSWSGNL